MPLEIISKRTKITFKNIVTLGKVNDMIDSFDQIDKYGFNNLGGGYDGLINANEFDKWKMTQPLNLPA